jgi:hypothetical protein
MFCLFGGKSVLHFYVTLESLCFACLALAEVDHRYWRIQKMFFCKGSLAKRSLFPSNNPFH